MPLHTGEALILRTYKLAEADRIVVFLTRDRGKKRGVAKGARRLRSRFGGALEPLTRVGVAYFEKETRELVSLNYMEPIRSPMATAGGEGLGLVEYFADLLDEWAPESDPSEKLFRLGASTLEALAAGAPLDRLARYFELWLLRLQGVYPSLAACPRCGSDLGRAGAVVSPRDRVFVCAACGPGEHEADLSPEAIGFLRRAVHVGPDRLGELPLSAQAAREIEQAHRTIIRSHLEKDLKSARVLRDMRM